MHVEVLATLMILCILLVSASACSFVPGTKSSSGCGRTDSIASMVYFLNRFSSSSSCSFADVHCIFLT